MEMNSKSETFSYRMPCCSPYSDIRPTSHQRSETLRKMGCQTSCVRFQCGSIEFIQTISKTLKNDCRTRWVVLASQIDQNDCTMSILKITHQFLHFSFVRLWMWWLKQSCFKCLCIFQFRSNLWCCFDLQTHFSNSFSYVSDSERQSFINNHEPHRSLIFRNLN